MNHKVLKRAIGICWIILVVCVFVKAVGGNWFASNITSTYLDSNILLITGISSIVSYLLFNFYYLAICEIPVLKTWIHLALIPYFILVSVLKVFVVPGVYHLIFDLSSNFIIPFLIMVYLRGGFKKVSSEDWLRIVMAYVITCGLQAISVMIKDISVTVVITSFIAQLLMTIDVLIMLVLYWLYSLLYKKEVKDMSLVFCFLMGKGEAELKEMLAKTNDKLAKDPENASLKEEKAAIEKALSELN